jgi:hypothetical protein
MAGWPLPRVRQPISRSLRECSGGRPVFITTGCGLELDAAPSDGQHDARGAKTRIGTSS